MAFCQVFILANLCRPHFHIPNSLSKLYHLKFCYLLYDNRWFGKTSSTKKIIRETKELRIALAPTITGNRNAVKNEYSSALLDLLLYNLKDGTKVKLIYMFSVFDCDSN